MKDETPDGEIRIILKKTSTGYTSRHELVAITEAAAAVILIDVGRNILLHLASHHHEEVKPDGH